MARNTTLIRLALALLIGAVAGPWFNLTHPTALDAVLNALAIAVPPLLAVALAKPASSGGALLRVIVAVAFLVVLLPLGDLLLNALQGFPKFDTTFLVGMAVVLCPLIAAFAVGTRGSARRSGWRSVVACWRGLAWACTTCSSHCFSASIHRLAHRATLAIWSSPCCWCSMQSVSLSRCCWACSARRCGSGWRGQPIPCSCNALHLLATARFILPRSLPN
jgi:hypothetical protein